jgi:hypothetical protein
MLLLLPDVPDPPKFVVLHNGSITFEFDGVQALMGNAAAATSDGRACMCGCIAAVGKRRLLAVAFNQAFGGLLCVGSAAAAAVAQESGGAAVLVQLVTACLLTQAK